MIQGRKWEAKENSWGNNCRKLGIFTYFYHQEFSRMSPWSLLRTSSHFIKNRPGAELTHGYVARQTCRTHQEHSKKKQDLIPNRRFFQLTKTLGFFPTKRCHFHSISWFKRLYISKRLMGWTSTNSKNGVFSNGRDFSSHMRRSWWKLSPTSAIDLPSTMLHNL